jgi:hypothetical protein
MSDYRLLTADAELPDVPAAPAPWRLKGDGWILLLRLPEAARHDPRHLPPGLAGLRPGGPAVLMFVDYASSPAGPYRELLYMPGRFTLADGRKAWSVTRIYVSSWESVVNGRRNWGIPKDRADFLRLPAAGGERLEVRHEGRLVAAATLSALGPALPVTARLLPAELRRLVQWHGGQRFEFVPGASGRAGLARVRALESDPELFPSLVGAKVLAATRAVGFSLEFPVARIVGEPVTG